MVLLAKGPSPWLCIISIGSRALGTLLPINNSTWLPSDTSGRSIPCRYGHGTRSSLVIISPLFMGIDFCTYTSGNSMGLLPCTSDTFNPVSLLAFTFSTPLIVCILSLVFVPCMDSLLLRDSEQNTAVLLLSSRAYDFTTLPVSRDSTVTGTTDKTDVRAPAPVRPQEVVTLGGCCGGVSSLVGCCCGGVSQCKTVACRFLQILHDSLFLQSLTRCEPLFRHP